MDNLRPHATTTYKAWRKLQKLINGQEIKANGHELEIAIVVAVSKYGCSPHLDLNEDVVRGMNESVDLLQSSLFKGHFVYGVNTGYGGSADTRTRNHVVLQVALLQHTQSAVVTSFDKGGDSAAHIDVSSYAIPTPWVRGAMLVRGNQTIRGHSAVRVEVIETLYEMIRKNLTPVVPLRGTISASGDLMPLSYIAGALQGCPDIFVRSGEGIVSAEEALEKNNIKPIVLGPKEGLGLINGTAPSAALASLALYEAHQLAVIAQYLTILASEALGGNLEWLAPFIADVRPHIGQKEASANMLTFIAGSKLVSGIQFGKDHFKDGLCQDRYATRCSQQWIGPQLEDLMLAHTQVTTELNSTSDNPLVDVSHSDIHSGGNFQAASITAAMEKARLSLQMIGKMLFSQCTELINPALNNGLPANLAADDPSLSFGMKGIDVNVAAYMSELAYLANPISNHVQSAEQHNQAINSLAFISARYTMDAVDLVSLISASFIYVGCQALDLRVMHKTFLESFKPTLEAVTSEAFGSFLPSSSLATLQQNIWKNVTAAWHQTGSLDARQRCENVIATSISILSSGLIANEGPTPSPVCSVAALEKWRCYSHTAMHEHFISFRDKFFEKQNTVDYLGQASKKVYKFVRGGLGVPFHRGLVEHPVLGGIESNMISGREKKTIGSWVGIIHDSLRDGRLGGVVMETLAEELDVS